MVSSPMPSSILTSFLGGLQASLSVLLTILYGVVGTQFNLLDDASARKVSNICVKLFLPSLLLINIGSQLDLQSWHRYLPILVWGVVYNLMSLALGTIVTRIFKLPKWVTPAVTFNNTTAMPLLLIQSLGETNVLKHVLWGPDDTIDAALARAQSYFLVNSMISDSFTFGLGPKFLGQAEDGEEAEDIPSGSSVTYAGETPSYGAGLSGYDGGRTLSQSKIVQTGEQEENELREAEEEAIRVNEETSLLPMPVVRVRTGVSHRSYNFGKRVYDGLPRIVQRVLDSCFTFVSAPLVGGALGILIGLIPPLKKLFFAEPEQGGYFKAWLTTAIKNCGGLFATLQVVVVGVKLSHSLLAMRKGHSSGAISWAPAVFVLFVRFIIWPAISIPLIWVLAEKTRLIPEDPMLAFTLMIMPTGPPALKLQALADVAGSSEDEKMGMAKFLTISYFVCPLMAFAVVGGLKASQAVSY